jgi:hypothetical protein
MTEGRGEDTAELPQGIKNEELTNNQQRDWR